VVDNISRLQSYSLLDSLNGQVHLILERFSPYIGANGHIGMSYPSIQRPLIQRSGLFRSLMSGCIIGQGIKFLCAVGSSIHEDDTVVPLVPHPRPRPSLLVQYCLVRFLGHVCRAIGYPPVAEDQTGAFTHLCQFSDVILDIYLEFDDIRLELNDVPRVVPGEVREPSSHADYGRYLGNKEHLETAFGEVFLNGL
jgi:hypothetical protein